MEYSFEAGQPVALCVRALLEWISRSQATDTWTSSPPLTLPPLQRNGVWRPKQVLDLWRSVLDGLPIGLLYLQAAEAGSCVVNPDDRTKLTKLSGPSWDLFDGQQRIRALALGTGDPFGEDRCIWVRFEDGSYELILSSRAQPAGYGPDGRKLSLRERGDWLEANLKKDTIRALSPEQKGVPWWKTADPPAKCSRENTVRLACLLGWAPDLPGQDPFPGPLPQKLTVAYQKWHRDVVNLKQPNAVFMRLPEVVGSSVEKSLELFRRVGAGGTPLSQPEQLYAAYKAVKPELREVVESIQKMVSAILTPAQIIQAAIRMAYTQELPSTGWAPGFDTALKALSTKSVSNEGKWVCQLDGLLTRVGEWAPLEGAFRQVLELLKKSPSDDTFYLPAIALAQLPAELWQVLAFWWIQNKPTNSVDREEIVRFAMFWRLAVTNDERAAQTCFRALQRDKMKIFNGRLLYDKILAAGKYAYRIATPAEMDLFFLPDPSGASRDWLSYHGRFTANTEHHELADTWWFGTKILPWLQRHYIDELFKGRAPLSDHEDDLPYDVDHICPKAHWAPDGRGRVRLSEKMGFEDNKDREKRMGQTWVVGEALGNKRLVDFARNRGDGADMLAKKLPFLKEDSYEVSKFGIAANFSMDGQSLPKWIEVDATAKEGDPRFWSQERLHALQSVVECRTAELYSKFYNELKFFKWLDNSSP